MGTEVGSLNHGDASSQIPLTQLPASRTPLLLHGIKGKLIPVNYQERRNWEYLMDKGESRALRGVRRTWFIV